MHTHHVPVIPELVLGELPPGTRVLVLTHDHAEDLAIIDAALRCDHLGADRADRVVGQVGAVPAQLLASFPAEVVDRVETPIGLPGVTPARTRRRSRSRVAAALLRRLRARAQRARSAAA